ncbi:unnamed protein product [Peniophora sp. CBMAI 1063]|nr:unnamed protein product [Peniophora sp. CBMAI 1063]
MGDYTSDPILSDADPNLDNFKNTLAHNTVNDVLVAADGEVQRYVRSYIVMPSMVYGALKGPLVDAGIAHAYNITIPTMIKLCLQRGQVAMVGKGLNRWPVKHIDDTADFYKLILQHALADDAPHGAQGTYVTENGEVTLAVGAKWYMKALHAHGKSAKAEPESFTTAEIEKNPFLSYMGTDDRIRGDRARQIGWYPAHGVEDFFECVQQEVEDILAVRE